MLISQQVSFFQQNGYLSGLPVVGTAQSARYRQQFDFLEAAEGAERCRTGLLDRHFDQDFIHELAIHPSVLDAVEALVGPDILLLATHFFCKYGRDEKFVAWHQDLTYWALEPPQAVTAWYAIDDSDCENGCMRVLPGTHLGGIREHGKAEASGNLLSINQEIPVTMEEESRAVDLVLRAGEISLHDGFLIHGSLPNLSERRRCGLTLRYVPTYVKPIGINSQGRRWNPVLVRGTDRYRHFGQEAAARS